MNAAEKLARELVRVASLRHDYEEIGPPGRLALTMIDLALEAGCVAAGTNDVVEVLRALAYLEGITR